MHLRPCTSCLRHVRNDETRCVFCDARLEVEDIGPAAPSARIGRAARMAFGAALATASLAGCEDPKPTADPPKATTTTAPATTATTTATMTASATATASATETAAASASASAAPSVTASASASASVHAPVDAGKPHAVKIPPHINIAKPYGAPPADGLLV